MTRISFEGLDELSDGLLERSKLDIARRLIRKHGANLNQKMVRNAVFTGGRTGKYTTGQTRRSIALTFHNDDLEARVKPSTEYSPYVEHGTRFMKAQPFVAPAFREVKEQFKRELKDLT